jgi:hypothetical protein
LPLCIHSHGRLQSEELMGCQLVSTEGGVLLLSYRPPCTTPFFSSPLSSPILSTCTTHYLHTRYLQG